MTCPVFDPRLIPINKRACPLRRVFARATNAIVTRRNPSDSGKSKMSYHISNRVINLRLTISTSVR